jgi:hypothetical protein
MDGYGSRRTTSCHAAEEAGQPLAFGPYDKCGDHHPKGFGTMVAALAMYWQDAPG